MDGCLCDIIDEDQEVAARPLPTVRFDFRGCCLPRPAASSLLAHTIILSKTIIGAGAAALPRAFDMLGLLCAGGFLLLVAYMTREWGGESAAPRAQLTSVTLQAELCCWGGGESC
jgi:hypothetical protein